jgi:hypothetical protein
MSEIVDRAGHVLYPEFYDEPVMTMPGGQPPRPMRPDELAVALKYARNQVRKVLATIYRPTPAMIEAGIAAFTESRGDIGDVLAKAWQAMLDEAQK